MSVEFQDERCARADSTTTVIDPHRWPGVASVPRRWAQGVRSRAARSLFTRAVSRLPLRVEFPDGRIAGQGSGTDSLPRMIIHDADALFARLGSGGLIGFGESYMAGEWDASDLERVLEVFAASVADLVPKSLQSLRAVTVRRQPRRERNTAENTRSNISRHYDLSNAFFRLFLDETMTYSAGLFTNPETASWEELADAQHRKIDRLLDQAGVGEGTRVLEIGTGWGELAIRAAQRGANVRSVTLSVAQKELADQRIKSLGLNNQVQVQILDYRAVEGEFDAILSVEMIEAVGYQYWPTYFRKIDELLAPGGTAAIQAITMPHHRMLATRNTYTWIHKYIFPGGLIPSVEAIRHTTERETNLRIRDQFSMGPHYARTLRLWEERFSARFDEARALGFDEVFRRMWKFYLCYSEAGFASGYLDVEQLVFSRPGGPAVPAPTKEN
ncbi:SAM-dependent methyltransferase [Hoyosella subflava]|uniref:Cyclopropane-fatty-acyl-phospholipid synthase n=1 Tax=Hoyosella subflava (strain DSM 45089 / JCM 17490 / NBRC 109087 / DQS3-9A1) TaxID=443218 RepID=F6EMK1_HOYSD|nr:Cyclopropane-fatty-acyl-phospholipid synthase [Hoyosella subflava DQS3-9A1]